MGQLCLWLAGGPGQGAGHQFLADADAETAGDQLVEQEPLGAAERLPCGKDKGLALRFRQIGKTAQFGDPVGQGTVIAGGVRRQHQRDGFGQIADNGIAVLEQPQGDACHLGRPFAQAGGGDRALGSAAGEQGDCPQAIRICRVAKVVGQCRDLHICLGALVDGVEELREPLHVASPASRVSPSNCVGMTCACQPFSFR